jgi:hypothetical protein
MPSMKISRLVLAVVLCSSAFLFGETDTPDTSGNAFVRLCSSVERGMSTQIEVGYVMGCVGYVAGFIDGVRFGTAYAEDKAGKKVPSLLCFPDEVENGQITKILLKYIRENPKEAHQRTAVLLAIALQQAYPCPSK